MNCIIKEEWNVGFNYTLMCLYFIVIILLLRRYVFFCVEVKRVKVRYLL